MPSFIHKLGYTRRLGAVWIVIWTVLLSGFALEERGHIYRTAEERALLWARASFEKDVVYRIWNAGHGGVYAPVTGTTKPNPDLDVPHREIIHPSGAVYTLVDPAYMTRQVQEIGMERFGLRVHITSLRPIRPENAPDGWERRALERLDAGESEFREVTRGEGGDFLRYMKSLQTEKACLKCHAAQGYVEGDVRGGISVSVPLAPYYAVARERATGNAVIHFFIWVSGLAGIIVSIMLLRTRERDRAQWTGALQLSERRYRMLSENAPIGIFQADANGEMRYVNRQWTEIAGMGQEEALGRGWFDAVHPDDREHVTNMWLSSAAAKAPFDARFSFGGPVSRRVVRSSAVPMISDIGELTGFIGTVEDITAQHEAEERLTLSERRLALVFNNITDYLMLLEVDQDGRYRVLSINRSFADYISSVGAGTVAREFLNAPLGEVMADIFRMEEDVVERSLANIRRVILDGKPAVFRESYRFFEDEMQGIVTIVPILDAGGRCSHILWSCRDISVRSRIMQSLVEMEARYAQLSSSMIDGYALVQAVYREDGEVQDYRFITINPAFEEMFGVDMSSAVGRTARELFADINGEWLSLCGEIAQGKPGTRFERYIPSRNQWLEGYAYCPWPGQCAMIVSDITTEKLAAEEKRLLEEQLRQSSKMEAVGQLASGIAHDFNNILTSVISNAYILKKRIGEGDPLTLFVADILAESGRAASMVRDLLSFARKQPMHFRAVSIAGVISGMEGLFRRLIGEDIELVIGDAPVDATALADAGQIEQVLMNLVTNARDAMPNGGRLEISTEIAVPDQTVRLRLGLGGAPCFVRIIIRDTGIGISPDVVERIFEPFFTTKGVGKGTGLGLAIAYGIVRQHHGGIGVESTPGRGATFSVYLPCAAATEKGVDIRTERKSRGGTETILLAEDEPSVRKGTRQVLEDAGYKIIEAGDGEEAIDRFKEVAGNVDLVLLDVIMPRKSGKDAYEAISVMKPGVKVIFMSGYTGDIIDRKGMSALGHNFLMKPILPPDLLGTVREVLDS